MRKSKDIYALYKGDRFLELGTVNELAAYLNVSPRTIRFYASNTYKKRMKGNNYYIVIKVEEDD